MAKKLSQCVFALIILSILAVVITVLGIGFLMVMNTPFIHCLIFGAMIYTAWKFFFE